MSSNTDNEFDLLKAKLLRLLDTYPQLKDFYMKSINDETSLSRLKRTQQIMNERIINIVSKQHAGRHREMNVKDIKELCKANQIKLSRVVDGKRVAYKKKELMTKLKRKKLL